jgi:hypothetical protein
MGKRKHYVVVPGDGVPCPRCARSTKKTSKLVEQQLSRENENRREWLARVGLKIINRAKDDGWCERENR